MTQPATENRPRLSRERVVETAIAMADGSGIEAVSMRRLAQELGVEAMSLYHYFARKDDIFEGMLDAVWAEVEHPTAEEEWRPALRRTCLSAFRALMGHPWATGLIGSSASVSGARLRWMDSVLATLRRAGFAPGTLDLAYHVLDSHIVGVVLWALPYLAIERTNPNFAEEFLATFPLAETPDLKAHIDYHLAPRDETGPGPFEFGLDLILDGLERLGNR